MVEKHHHLEDRRSEHTPQGLAYRNSNTMRHPFSNTTTNMKKTTAMAEATMTMEVVTIRAMEDRIKATADNIMTETTREARQFRITHSKTTIILGPIAAMDLLLDLLLPVPVPVPVGVDRQCKEAEPGLLVRCVLPQTMAGVLQVLIRHVVAVTLRARDGVIRPKVPVGGQVPRIEL